jgi:hypothetical protein
MKINMITKLVNLIQNCIDSKLINRNQVRQIIVGLSENGQCINIWQNERWDNYEEYDDEEAIASISNSSWLDALDDLTFSSVNEKSEYDFDPEFLPNLGVNFQDEKLQLAYYRLLKEKVDEIKETLQEIAQEQLLGKFGKQVGLMGVRISNSGYGDLVSIYHPQGTHLFPAKERRLPGYSSLYGQMALIEEGLIHFYTDDEGDSKVYSFKDMDFFYSHEDRVTFQLSTSAQLIEFDAGNTNEEWGYPSCDIISNLLLNHFQRQDELLFNPNKAPSVSQKEQWNKWLGHYTKYADKSPEKIIENALKDDDYDTVEAFISSQNFTDKEIRDFNSLYISHSIKKGDYSAVIKHFDISNKEKLNGYHWNDYYRALAMTGDYETIFFQTEAQVSLETKSLVHMSFYILSGLRLGKKKDLFEQLIEKMEKKRKDSTFYVAKALMNSQQVDVYKDALFKAIADDYKAEYLAEDFKYFPAILEEGEKLLAMFNKEHVLGDEIKKLLESSSVPSEVDENWLSPHEDFIHRWSQGEEKALYRTIKEADENPVKRELFRDEKNVWIATKNGFARLVPDAESFTLTNVYEGCSPSELAVKDSYIYVACSGMLKTFSFTEAETPVLVFEQTLLGHTSLIIEDDLLVVSSQRKILFYTLQDPEKPELISFFSLTSHGVSNYKFFELNNVLFLRDKILYVPLQGGKGCIAVDVSLPEKPVVLSFLPFNWDVEKIAGMDQDVFFYKKDGIIRADYSDPKKPFIKQNICFDNCDYFNVLSISKDEIEFIGKSDGYSFFNLQFSSQNNAYSYNSFPLLKVEEDIVNGTYYIKSIVKHPQNKSFTVFHEYGLTEFSSEALPLFPQISEDQGKEIHSKLEGWIIDKLESFASQRPDDAIGHCHFKMYGDFFYFYLDGQKSLPGIHLGSIGRWDESAFKEIHYQERWSQITGFTGLADLKDESSLRDWIIPLLTESFTEIYSESILKIAQTELFKKIATGRYYLTRNFGAPEVFAFSENKGRFNPWRQKIKEICEPSLEEKLKDHDTWRSFAQECDSDSKLKTELYELARSGNSNALQVVRRRFKMDSDSISLVAEAADKKETYLFLSFLKPYDDHEAVITACFNIYNRLILKLEDVLTDQGGKVKSIRGQLKWIKGLIKSADIIGKQESKELESLVDLLLFKNKPNFSSYDLVVEYLKLRKDISSFKDLIQRAIDQMNERDNRLPAMAEQLFRAGGYDLPQSLLVQSFLEKQDEQYSGVKIGIKSLHDDSMQNNQSRVERLFTGKMILDKFRVLLANDDESSLWPGQLKPEPYPSSWKFLVQSVLLQMDIESELDDFITLLSKRLKIEDTYSADREIFAALMSIMIESQDFKRLDIMMLMLNEKPEVREQKCFSKLETARFNAELQLAWDANANNKNVKARELTDKLLKEERSHPSLAYLDARLAWKEQNDPAAAVALAESYLADMHFGSGKARLLNLAGCASDELQNYNEALKYFTEASQNDPETSFYFANIAEVHHKMGNKLKAQEWAKEARRRGSKEDILDEILGSNEHK